MHISLFIAAEWKGPNGALRFCLFPEILYKIGHILLSGGQKIRTSEGKRMLRGGGGKKIADFPENVWIFTPAPRAAKPRLSLYICICFQKLQSIHKLGLGEHG